MSNDSIFSGYAPYSGVYDEIFSDEGRVRDDVSQAIKTIDELSVESLYEKQKFVDASFLKNGITFTVYSDSQGTEKIFPFDLIPRIISEKEWQELEKGLKQRLKALNAFLNDIYDEQKILKDGVIPRELVESSEEYLPEMRGVKPPHGVYCHIAGLDLIKDESGFMVLEDNVRTPSGVSYVLENRNSLMKVLPEAFSNANIKKVVDYPTELRKALSSISPVVDGKKGLSVVLTPGQYNSAYFEHSYLARKMGCELVQGSDLFVHNNYVYLKTTKGPKLVTVVYRRIDDKFLDPEFFNPESMLGVPGIIEAYKAGNVVLANAVGNGIADDKAIYPYVHKMIEYYLNEKPILAQVKTYFCSEENDRNYVLSNLDKLVVKEANGSGGYGMLIGPQASVEELQEFAAKIKEKPRAYIAQPLVELSTSPTFIDGKVLPRRVDLRAFLVSGKDTWILPGGLARVALKEGSYVVNSSQGGGSKDTWVLGR
ncbi:circularly permuted type 2 ATP-grasp protein [Francisella philomiragia]|uniref:A circularly permuted ATPgrasp family protein n=1 Tax=Francisella philomiragia TaxID=28110 RepID=A0AAW3D867_9GAMM|nr:circularly permuted type 2 ATP-grasp protein [Francisella philomiragia]KFJ42126.1 A circularly permuted ATPgrasp family protein [Francisella philomiragia]MBK2093403.1 circularly permuted type 2 ATP-grasp protein [Francisella philomiragia]MBK2094820.1 circularly permuted type 2 ATP-grasp protein [Francisella philomiragia]MBK2254185.1 circularly permuted type 2 ATP-grasp protein [Francisella philomiragia]MBK2255873.1 circularly permuted type 2 ATP-grasp protein [Francisella philomiragia]